MLFLDEPTSGVDPITRREFWTHINGLVEQGVTVLVTTHFMDEAEYCDRIALIYRGRAIACGSPDELKARVATKDERRSDAGGRLHRAGRGQSDAQRRPHERRGSSSQRRPCRRSTAGCAASRRWCARRAADPPRPEQHPDRLRAAADPALPLRLRASRSIATRTRIGLVLEEPTPRRARSRRELRGLALLRRAHRPRPARQFEDDLVARPDPRHRRHSRRPSPPISDARPPSRQSRSSSTAPIRTPRASCRTTRRVLCQLGERSARRADTAQRRADQCRSSASGSTRSSPAASS